MTLSLIVFLSCLAGLLRMGFIISGLHKAPIIALFEKYGDPPPFYYPWTQILIWLGLAAISGGFLITTSRAISFLGLLFLFVAWLSHMWREPIIEVLRRFPQVPRWYDTFVDQTSRYERRRIAYMWLRLPTRTRWIYNASDNFFFQWTDLVILATVHDG